MRDDLAKELLKQKEKAAMLNLDGDANEECLKHVSTCHIYLSDNVNAFPLTLHSKAIPCRSIAALLKRQRMTISKNDNSFLGDE